MFAFSLYLPWDDQETHQYSLSINQSKYENKELLI